MGMVSFKLKHCFISEGIYEPIVLNSNLRYSITLNI